MFKSPHIPNYVLHHATFTLQELAGKDYKEESTFRSQKHFGLLIRIIMFLQNTWKFEWANKSGGYPPIDSVFDIGAGGGTCLWWWCGGWRTCCCCCCCWCCCCCCLFGKWLKCLCSDGTYKQSCIFLALQLNSFSLHFKLNYWFICHLMLLFVSTTNLYKILFVSMLKLCSDWCFLNV